MNNQGIWNDVKVQLEKITKNLSAKRRSEINDIIFKQSSKIMKEKSLSLIYDKYGNQLYEKTPDIINYISCNKNGFNTNINADESKLVETKNIYDKTNTDFIPYGSIENINQNDIKNNFYTGFDAKNDYLYTTIEKKQLKDKVFNDGVNEIKSWINTSGKKEINKKNEDFIGFVK